jgi:hypothetical protein
MKQKRQSPVNIELVLFTVKMKQKRQSPVNIEFNRSLIFLLHLCIKNDHSILTGD